ncbi:MAG: winged helix-turn-helix transcriptional regulator, partial [Anaerolineales bacterium]|nr:winged helix-turn-helix transcriptional regulator [Anaerolineales bacterium]
AIQSVTSREAHGCWHRVLAPAETLTFIPSPHIGPYLLHYAYGPVVRVVFDARLPQGVERGLAGLTRTDLLVQLRALADDTRLRILKYIVDHGEQSSKEIMDTLDLSQSATSRHLRQLNATGYLIARRVESAKYFDINPERIESTLQAISAFLLGS